MDISQLYNIFKGSTGVSTDTRKIQKGNLFFALKGPNFNANFLVKQAIESGASYCVIDEKEFFIPEKTILVKDVLQTLQQLALHHRKNFLFPVIAITGSNGKTTTKELASAVLSTSFKTYSTPGNFNNHIGVPITLLSVPAETQMLVIELGANHLGENKFLCELSEPDYGIITNNGKDHLEGYGGLEGVRKGNGEVYEYLKRKNAKAFVSSVQEDLMVNSQTMNRIIYGAHKNSIVSAQIIKSFPLLQVKLLFENNETAEVQTQLTGDYNLENILAASAIGYYFKVSVSKIKFAIENYRPANNRSQFLEKDGNNFILDAYNANPSSMKLALENFSLLPLENKIAVLGEMAELGKYSLEEHQLILDLCSSIEFKEIWLVGKEFSIAKTSSQLKNKEVKFFQDVEEAKKYFLKKKFTGYSFLFKGSRKNKLEQMIL